MKRIFLFFISILLSINCLAFAEDQKPLSLVDAAGRTILFKKSPQRIVSCYFISSSALLGLGLNNQLVGIEKKAESRPIYRLTDESLLALPQIGSMKEINVEAVAALEPDLVILPQKCISYVESFEAISLPVLIVNPEDEQGMRDMLRLLGTACGMPERMEALLANIDQVMTFSVPMDGQTALFLGNSSYRTVAPEGMYQSTLLQKSGYQNAASSLKASYWTEVSMESILAWNPDVIILPSDAAYTVEDLKSSFDEAGLSFPKAILEGRVYQMPGCIEAWDSPVPSSILGVEWLRAKHGLRNMNELREEVKLFYETFYGFTPNEELLSAIQ